MSKTTIKKIVDLYSKAPEFKREIQEYFLQQILKLAQSADGNPTLFETQNSRNAYIFLITKCQGNDSINDEAVKKLIKLDLYPWEIHNVPSNMKQEVIDTLCEIINISEDQAKENNFSIDKLQSDLSDLFLGVNNTVIVNNEGIAF